MPLPKTYRSLQRISDLSRRIAGALMHLHGRVLEQDDFVRMVDTLQIIFKEVDRDTLETSVRPELGQTAEPKLIEALARRLAGAELRLLQHRAVPGWRPLPVDEYVPVLFREVKPCASPFRSRQNERGAEVAMVVLGGTAIDKTIKRWWSSAALAAIARSRTEKDGRSSFGFQFARVRGQRTPLNCYERPTELTGLRCLFRIPAMAPELKLAELAFDSDAIRHNARIQKLRARVNEEAPCPHDIPQQIACRDCPVGRGSCEAATHARNYQVKVCRECKRKAYVDMRRDAARCVRCLEKAAVAAS